MGDEGARPLLHVERASRICLDLPIQLGNWPPRRCPRQASLLGQGREEVGQSPRPPPSPEARNRWCRHCLLRRHLRCLQRRPHRLLRGRAPPVRLRRCRSPHPDGEARRRGQALRRSHPHRHEEVNFISRTWYYKSIIDPFREFSSTSPEEKESAERRRSNYIPTILFLLMSIRMPDGKKSSWGGEGDSEAGNGRAYVCGCISRDAALYVSRAFFLAKYFLFSLSRHKLKKKNRNCLFLMFFFFYKEVYLLIVIF